MKGLVKGLMKGSNRATRIASARESSSCVPLKEEVLKQEEWESGLLYDTQEECEEEAEDTAEPRDESPQLRIVPDQDQLRCHERFTSSDEESEYYSPNE